MTTVKGLLIGVFTIMAWNSLTTAQPVAVDSEKPQLIQTLREIQELVMRIQEEQRTSFSATADIQRSAKWLENMATQWSPKKPGEGQPLLDSLRRMLRVLRNAPARETELETLLLAIRDDLWIKAEHCQQKGLITPQRVFVVTKRNGLREIPGLSVLYIEKFFESDPNAKPQEFRRFSSPAVDDLVPGRYLIWAKETKVGGRSGERKEARIGNGEPKDPIEVLTP